MSKCMRFRRDGALIETATAVVLAFGLAMFWLPQAYAAENTPRDSELLQGMWSAVAKFDKDGKRRAVRKTDDDYFTLSFEKGSVTVASKELNFTARFAVRPDVNPKEIDVIRTLEGGVTWTFRGIYEVEGDRLRLALGGPQDPRAKQFRRASGVEIAVEMKRQK